MSEFTKDKPDEYYEGLDKRKKEYKSWIEWKKNFDKENSTGLGDMVEKFTEATGIKDLVDTFTPEGKDCGCDKRKEKANNIRFRFKPVRCFTEDQYNSWTEFVGRDRKNEVTTKQQIEVIIPIYQQLFARQLKPMSCCIKPYIDDINRIYELY